MNSRQWVLYWEMGLGWKQEERRSWCSTLISLMLGVLVTGC